MLIEQGSTLRAAAAALSVAPATAHRWWHRWRHASEASARRGRGARAAAGAAVVSVGAERRAGAGDPRRAREDELGADAADVSDRPASLDGLEGAQAPRRLAPAPQRAAGRRSRRYEWAEAGALLHIDAFERPSSTARATGRTASALSGTAPAGPARAWSSASSTTTPAWSTASCTPPRTRTPSRARCAAPPPGCASRAAARSRR